MFFHSKLFNQPLNNWNVFNVNNMYCLFMRCESFNQPLNNWNVSNNTDIRYIFEDTLAFDEKNSF